MNEVARDVTDPQTKISVLQRRQSRDILSAANAKAKKELLAKKTISLGALGSGSDYSPFIQHLGISCFNLGFGGEDAGGEYHSIYDSYDLYKRFKDPTFEYGVALAGLAGRTTLRMVDISLLPFDFKSFYKTVNGYVSELSTLLEQTRENTAVENQLIKEKRYDYAEDPTEKLLIPKIKDEVPFLNFSSLQNSMSTLEKATNRLSDSLSSPKLSAAQKNQINQKLYRAEQQLLSTGLPRRPWYRHTIYAPGFYTGYGVKTMPGIREAIEQRNWKEAQEQIDLDADVLSKFAQYLDGVSELAK